MDELESLIEELQESVKTAVNCTSPANYVQVQEIPINRTNPPHGSSSIFQENVMEIEKMLGELDEPIASSREGSITSPMQSNSGISSPAFALESLMQDIKQFQLQHELALTKIGANSNSNSASQLPSLANQQPAVGPSSSSRSSPAESAMRKNFPNQSARPGASSQQQQQQQQKPAAAAVDMSKCAGCNETIQGQMVKALGRAWHYEHFVCSGCQSELGKQNFYEKDSKPFCEPCYQSEFSPKCAYCQGAILDRCITALEKSWHPEHFFCQQCTAPFTETSGFHERNGKPYCAECYNDAFAPKCSGCDKAITSNYVTALESMWHSECFVCMDCGSDFSTGNFYEHNGKPYCELHYHAQRGSLCFTCEKPITSKCITAMSRKFHPECFSCAFCNNELSRGTFMEKDGKPYCNDCHGKLFVKQ